MTDEWLAWRTCQTNLHSLLQFNGRFVDLYNHIKWSTGNADSALTNVRDRYWRWPSVGAMMTMGLLEEVCYNLWQSTQVGSVPANISASFRDLQQKCNKIKWTLRHQQISKQNETQPIENVMSLNFLFVSFVAVVSAKLLICSGVLGLYSALKNDVETWSRWHMTCYFSSLSEGEKKSEIRIFSTSCCAIPKKRERE